MAEATQSARAGAKVRCRACLSEIDARARRCPHCARWQGRLSTESVLAVGSALFWVVIMAGWLPLWLAIDRLLAEFAIGRASPTAAADLRLIDSTMLTGRWGGQNRLAVLGRIRNQGDEPLGWLQIEAQFRDREGTLVDTATEFAFRWGGKVLPGQERAFRIDVEAELPLEFYHSCKVFLRSARRSDTSW